MTFPMRELVVVVTELRGSERRLCFLLVVAVTRSRAELNITGSSNCQNHFLFLTRRILYRFEEYKYL